MIGKPPTCNETITCPKCGVKISDHTTISLEKHFIDHYGARLKRLRNIRHKTFHKGEYYDLTESWVRLYMELHKSGHKTSNKLENVGRLEQRIWELEYVVEERLKELFLEEYSTYQVS